MNKNLEFWRKIGLSFEILGVLAKLSFGENVEKKACPTRVNLITPAISVYATYRIYRYFLLLVIVNCDVKHHKASN